MHGRATILGTVTCTLILFLLASLLGAEGVGYGRHEVVADKQSETSLRPSLRSATILVQDMRGTAKNGKSVHQVGQLSLSSTMCTPLTQKWLAYQTMQSATNSHIGKCGKKFERVTASMEASLAPRLWTDSWHVSEQKMGSISDASSLFLGESAFSTNALRSLNKFSIDPSLPNPIRGHLSVAAKRLVNADRLLAGLRLKEAIKSGGDPHELAKVKTEVNRAEMEMAKPDPAYDVVSSHCCRAWVLAVLAEKKTFPESSDGAQVSLAGERKPIFCLGIPYPNPTTSGFHIRYAIAEEVRVVLEVSDVSGAHIRTLANDKKPPGYYDCKWNGKDEKGEPLANGAYFFRLAAGQFRDTRKVVLLR